MIETLRGKVSECLTIWAEGSQGLSFFVFPFLPSRFVDFSVDDSRHG